MNIVLAIKKGKTGVNRRKKDEKGKLGLWRSYASDRPGLKRNPTADIKGTKTTFLTPPGLHSTSYIVHGRLFITHPALHLEFSAHFLSPSAIPLRFSPQAGALCSPESFALQFPTHHTGLFSSLSFSAPK